MRCDAYYYLLTSFCLVSPVLSQSLPDLLGQVTTAFTDAKVVEDVVSTFNPSAYVNMMFTDPTTGHGLTPTAGQSLTMAQTSGDPQYSLIAVNGTSDPRAFGPLVLVMVDPDAPTPQDRSNSQIIHFLGSNFTLGEGTGTALANGSVALLRYWMPRPQNGSDPHRYVLLVYPQPSDFDTEVLTYFASVDWTRDPTLEDRSKFNVSHFAAQMNLGEPLAGNFFKVGPNVDLSNATTTVSSAATTTRAPPTLTPLTGAAKGTHGATMEAGAVVKILGLSMAMSLLATLTLA
ncbi:hypothetical protein NMY22_g5690 [Coprinellus aureogranulatus]|nr:hypothetical protein NMY22_g5690 [Coprinellus aureogranulatus]